MEMERWRWRGRRRQRQRQRGRLNAGPVLGGSRRVGARSGHPRSATLPCRGRGGKRNTPGRNFSVSGAGPLRSGAGPEPACQNRHGATQTACGLRRSGPVRRACAGWGRYPARSRTRRGAPADRPLARRQPLGRSHAGTRPVPPNAGQCLPARGQCPTYGSSRGVGHAGGLVPAGTLCRRGELRQ